MISALIWSGQWLSHKGIAGKMLVLAREMWAGEALAVYQPRGVAGPATSTCRPTRDIRCDSNKRDLEACSERGKILVQGP